MHSTLSIASLLLAASGALAYPQQTTNLTASSAPADSEVRVVLQSQATETGSQTVFKSVDSRKHKKPVGSSGPFETINIIVGADANQDLRCQALDMDGIPLIATRGENTDITFSDGGPDKNEWTFVTPSEVSRIVCDPAFIQATPEDFEIRVTLATDDLATQTVFEAFEGRAESAPTGSAGPYDSVEISVGKLLNPELRCKVIDARGRKIIATRGENVDTSFSDAGKGPWSFEQDRLRKVSKIVCDETFVAQPQ